MKKVVLIFTVMTLIVLGFTISCEKKTESCLENLCQNGGNCIVGICNCPNGFTGEKCEIDVCQNVTCDAPKTCLDGECICPTGFKGDNCEVKVVQSITVKEIIVSEFPSKKSDGALWDQDGNPDIAVAIFDNELQLFFSEIKQDVKPSEVHSYTCNYKFTTGLTTNYSIPLTEWDDDEYEFVGELILPLDQESLGFPDTVELKSIDTNQTDLTGKVVLSYGF